MGPRPDGRGKFILAGMVKNALERQWGRGQTAAESRAGLTWRPRMTCVNGAAARRPRKAAGVAKAASEGRASMGPRPDGRGKLIGGAGLRCAMTASMGPRPDGRGKAVQSHGEPAEEWRQWGRGQTAAER